MSFARRKPDDSAPQNDPSVDLVSISLSRIIWSRSLFAAIQRETVSLRRECEDGVMAGLSGPGTVPAERPMDFSPPAFMVLLFVRRSERGNNLPQSFAFVISGRRQSTCERRHSSGWIASPRQPWRAMTWATRFLSAADRLHELLGVALPFHLDFRRRTLNFAEITRCQLDIGRSKVLL